MDTHFKEKFFASLAALRERLYQPRNTPNTRKARVHENYRLFATNEGKAANGYNYSVLNHFVKYLLCELVVLQRSGL